MLPIDLLILQDLVQLNMNRIQQLNALETAQDSQEQAASASTVRETLSHETAAMPISRVISTQPLDVEGSWVPVAFTDTLGSGMTPFQHGGQPWILFRDAEGNAACIEDCCAHRACPLSLVSWGTHCL